MEAGAPPGGSRESKGIEAVKAKGEWWVANHEVHAATVEGPLVAGSHFAVTFKLDVTFKPQDKRFTMEEVAVYKVVDGKIVYEEFFYNMWNHSQWCLRARPENSLPVFCIPCGRDSAVTDS